MDIQFPPFLQKGDKVVIVSPSSKIDQQFLKGAKKRMESWGLESGYRKACRKFIRKICRDNQAAAERFAGCDGRP